MAQFDVDLVGGSGGSSGVTSVGGLVGIVGTTTPNATMNISSSGNNVTFDVNLAHNFVWAGTHTFNNNVSIAAGKLSTGGGGSAPTSWVPGLSTVSTVVSSTNNVTLICTLPGTQSANAQINGTSIGAQWVAGQVIPLKKNDTVMWTGSVAPTFIAMNA